MFQGGSPQWLCSNDLPAEGELTVTIKVRKANMEQHDGIDFTCIIVGVMESNQKGEQIGKTGNHCVYLSLKSQMIRGPNESR